MMQYTVKEDFLHYLWRTKKLNLTDCSLTSGERLEIQEYGIYNTDAGPDFFNGKIKIGETVWAGNIEMHVLSSDWELHGHRHDKAYDNVILHVVYEHDRELYRSDGILMPTLELKGKIPKLYLENYLRLRQSSDPIPCSNEIAKTNKDKLQLWLYKLVVERLERKVTPIQAILDETAGHWDECIYRMIARYMGTRVNAEAFSLLAQKLPLSILLKNRDNLHMLEALMYGQAGMLEAGYEDEYFKSLQKEYRHLKNKYTLSPIPGVMWKFSRMRPANFPTLRIAQLAALIHHQGNIFDKMINAANIAEIRLLFKNQVSEYWSRHYRFDHPSQKNHSGTLSSDMADVLIINAVAPVLFVYGRSTGDDRFTDRAVNLLESVPAEKNHIIAEWDSLGIKAAKAFESQALIQLRNEYCYHKRCLECSIGHQVLSL